MSGRVKIASRSSSSRSTGSGAVADQIRVRVREAHVVARLLAGRGQLARIAARASVGEKSRQPSSSGACRHEVGEPLAERAARSRPGGRCDRTSPSTTSARVSAWSKPSLVRIAMAPPSAFKSEQRVRSRHEIHAVDRALRDQRPVHRVAERLVEADAVLVDRETLRQAEQRRADEAAVLHVGLQRVALHLVDEHAAQGAVHEIGEIERALLPDLGRVGALARWWRFDRCRAPRRAASCRRPR